MAKHKPINNLGHYAHAAKVQKTNTAKPSKQQTVSADPKLIGPKVHPASVSKRAMKRKG